MTSLARDVRFGLRLLRRDPGFSVVAVATLALGIAATTAIVSVIHGTFFAPLPYRDADALVMVWSRYEAWRINVSPQDFVEWRRQATAFSDLNAWSGRGVNLAAAERPEHLQAGLATPGFLGMMGYGHPLALGRTFAAEEGVPGRDRVAILSFRLWRERFGGDPAILGRAIRLDGTQYTVVGVLGEGPADRQQNVLWLPLAFTPEQLAVENHSLYVMGRLKRGVTIAQAHANLTAVAEAVARARPESRPGWHVSVEPFRNNFVRRNTTQGLWLLLVAVAFLLLIACANVANLLLARGTARQRELMVRSAMGAGAGAIVRQLLAESLVLALAGGAVGILGAVVLIRAIVALMPPFTLPSETEIVLNVPVLVVALGACSAAGILAGCAPAWQAIRLDLSEAMKQGGRSVRGGRRVLSRALVAVEFALALTLLAGGGMAVHALVRLMRADLGFRTDRLLTFSLPSTPGHLATAEQMASFYRELLDRAATVPGVISAAVSTGMPPVGSGFGDGFRIVGRPDLDEATRSGARFTLVAPAYFETLGIALSRGRGFTDRDRPGSVPVAVVNEALVRRYMTGMDPLAQRLLVVPYEYGERATPPAPIEVQVVGVHRDVPNTGAAWEPMPEISLPFWQFPWPSVTMAVRAGGDPRAIQPALAAIIARLDPELPMTDVRTMEEALREVRAADRFHTVFLGAFATVALVLAAVGIYGVMSFVVAERTQEIGVRMALGAGRGQVLRQVIREGMTTAAIGSVVGAVGAWFVGRAMQGLVHGVEATPPWLFAAVALTLLAAALVACAIPARRAASVDPMVALRQE